MAWIIQLVQLVVQILKNTKGYLGIFLSVLILSAAIGLANYIVMDNEVKEFEKKINANYEKIDDLKESDKEKLIALSVIQTSLINLGESLKDVKDSVKRTEQRTWDILQHQLQKQEKKEQQNGRAKAD